MTDVIVAFPWRPTPDRERAFRFVSGWYRDNLPGAKIVAVDAGGAQFSRAASRNLAVRCAAAADVVVLNDADTIPTPRAVRAAITAAHHRGGLHFGLDTMRYLTEDETEQLYAGQRPRVTGIAHDSSVMAIRPADYWLAGGQDERFTGWGGEDGAFTSACTTFLGRPRWHHGTALSLWHAGDCRDIGSERWRPNGDLAGRYLAARGDIDAMRALIAERP